MWIGNFFLIVLNLPMIGLWVRLIMVPYHYLFPLILVFCGIGVFSLNNSDFDIHLMALFGFLGYVFAKLDCEPAPMLLGFILGPLMEEYLRRALIIGRGDWTVFVTNPISATMLVLAVVAMAFVLMPAIRKKRDEAFVEEALIDGSRVSTSPVRRRRKRGAPPGSWLRVAGGAPTCYNCEFIRHLSVGVARMAVERTLSIIKPDAVAANRHWPNLFAVRGQRTQGRRGANALAVARRSRRFLRGPPRTPVFQGPGRFHDVGSGDDPGARGG